MGFGVYVTPLLASSLLHVFPSCLYKLNVVRYDIAIIISRVRLKPSPDATDGAAETAETKP